MLRFRRRLVIGVDDFRPHSLSDNAVPLSARAIRGLSPLLVKPVFQRSKNYTSSGAATQRLSQQSEILHKNVKTALHDLNRPNWHHLLSRQIPPELWPAFACHKSGHTTREPAKNTGPPDMSIHHGNTRNLPHLSATRKPMPLLPLPADGCKH